MQRGKESKAKKGEKDLGGRPGEKGPLFWVQVKKKTQTNHEVGVAGRRNKNRKAKNSSTLKVCFGEGGRVEKGGPHP